LVLDGGADFAFVNPGLTPEQFPDDGVMELPGLFRDVREASMVYTRLVATGALRGYDDFFVVGAIVGGPQSIHTRPPISSLGDLRGKKIRASNRTEQAQGFYFGRPAPASELAASILGDFQKELPTPSSATAQHANLKLFKSSA
jgi:TRAP-type C4-dicarboxylate transport system substrate-binding protein